MDTSEITLPADIAKFLSEFPNDATSWHQATDEIRDFARLARTFLENEAIHLEPMNFHEIPTPARWNTDGKAFIHKAVGLMSEKMKGVFLPYVRNYFSINIDA